ncbi:MAG: outer membrane beta-barrel protein [Bauldia sp.]|mgnify:CR=1 FL=1
MNTVTKIAGLAAAALLALTAASTAADLRRAPAPAPIAVAPPPPPPALVYNWSGIYFGINGGWGWGEERLTSNAGNHYSYDIDGGFVGGTIGANVQSGMWVGGLEGDLDWSNIGSTGACATQTCETSIDWLGTGRLRLGVAMGNFMIYGTGGVAIGSVEATVSTPGGTDRQTHVGWTAGAGAEAALTGNLSVKAEWLYVDLGNKTHNIGSGAGFHEVANLVRLGLNWRM